MYKRILLLAAFFGLLVFGINALAVAFYWYTAMSWFDMLMHTLGGIFVAFVGASVLYQHIRKLPTRELLITLLLTVFIVGLAWEYYEYIVQFYIKSVRLADIADSISDLICDMLGGLVGTYFVILLNKRYNRG